ncbi:L,D-transpeptidase [Leekyejoonella antrihumi]|uniref:Murein L,D-transpeptidase n=1 Tax=Leekyejoonella antrihumi TaxID=1660198 RepID=A0A563E5W4_9MICO|nr:L,D-transpeptidase [Leekyejoonella antrihumi]TWP37930.1 murein L,D-transpeptidase [Leekyejoonella antrihumi]
MPAHRLNGRGLARSIGTTVLGVACGFLLIALGVVLAIKFFGGGSSHPEAAQTRLSAPAPAARHIAIPSVSVATLAKLPRATTMTTVKGAPVNESAPSGGEVVQIQTNIAGFAKPGANPITVIPSKQIGDQTWLPIIGRDANWIHVRLPSRPDGATAWIPGDGLRTARTDWAVKIALKQGTMTVTKGGKIMGEWTVGQGQSATPTPTGQTFLLAGFVDPTQTFSPVIYALGTHSRTLDTFGGGPGTVAVHGWPTKAGREGKVSHGCVRVPAGALSTFKKLPSGTPIDITA